MAKKTIQDLREEDLYGKRIFVRVDFNVPLEAGIITDDSRIRAALPTIQYLCEKNASVILASHLGNPKGKIDEGLRLAPIAKRLSQLMNKPIMTVRDCIGSEVEEKVSQLKPAEILLLENVRFYKEETENDPDFAKKLAGSADFYVQEAFGTAHRAHASTAGIAK